MTRIAPTRGPGAATEPAVVTLPDGGVATEVLELLWRRRVLSRAEIARLTGRSRSTISAVVARLLPTGLIDEVGSGNSRGGRRPILVGFQDGAGTIVGMDIGAVHVSVGITDLRGRILQWRRAAHPARRDPGGAVELAARLARECLAAAGGCVPAPMGVGVAVPSPVEPGARHRMLERILPAWRDFDLAGEVGARFNAPVFVDNDANLGALAEHRWGKAAGVSDFAYLKVSTGVGAGLILGGEIYRGATGVAGEIGHIAVDPRGPRCVCGNRGCLATLVGTPALLARARALLREYPASALGGGVLDLGALEDAALAHDPLALRVVEEAAQHLSIVIAGVLNLLNPGLVILGGSFARLGARLTDPISQAVAGQTLVASAAASDILTSELGGRATALGAATSVLVRALANPTLFPGVTTA